MTSTIYWDNELAVILHTIHLIWLVLFRYTDTLHSAKIKWIRFCTTFFYKLSRTLYGIFTFLITRLLCHWMQFAFMPKIIFRFCIFLIDKVNWRVRILFRFVRHCIWMSFLGIIHYSSFLNRLSAGRHCPKVLMKSKKMSWTFSYKFKYRVNLKLCQELCRRFPLLNSFPECI